jgi:hypothetical protein
MGGVNIKCRRLKMTGSKEGHELKSLPTFTFRKVVEAVK